MDRQSPPIGQGLEQPREVTLRAARERVLARYLAAWQGEADLDTIDELVTDEYVGHMGLGNRGLAELKRDIAAYRQSARNVRFSIHHRFGEGDYLATRVSVRATGANGEALTAAGLNISRWEGDRLAEEWAVWERLHPVEGT
jgi:SnoaL-like protein